MLTIPFAAGLRKVDTGVSRYYNGKSQPRKVLTSNFPEQLQADKLVVMRSTDATAANVYPMARPYVVTRDGARLVVGKDVSFGAYHALRADAERHESGQAQKARRAA
jgi:hypothetical protein